MSDKTEAVRALSVYIHIPFCRQKCAYCDFVSFAGQDRLIPAYAAELCREIRDQAERFPDLVVETVYIGGGTPSLLPGECVETILSELKASFKVAAGAEVSIEANPESVSERKAEHWLRAGVNRLSLGVQSFRDEELRMLGRIHDAQTARDAFRLLGRMGIENISLDLMYGLPGQNVSDWSESLNDVSALAPRHLSCYQLIPEEGTRLEERMRSGELPPVADEDDLLEMDRLTEKTVGSWGMKPYEVSNYAVPGYECRHNLNYWECGTYLGIGCAAHGDAGGKRTYNTESLREYLSGNPAGRRIPEGTNAPEDRRFERMMMGLRMMRGVDLLRFRNDFGAFPEEYWPESIAFMRKNSFLTVTEKRLALTKNGMRVMNALLVRMLEEQEQRAGSRKTAPAIRHITEQNKAIQSDYH